MTVAEFATAARLVLAQTLQRPGRLVVTSLSTIAAACVVVWVVSGYDSLVGRFGDLAEDYMGKYELYLVPQGAGEFRPLEDPRTLALPRELVESLRQDSEVTQVDPVFQTTVRLRKADVPANEKAVERAATAVRFNGGARQQREMSKSPALVGLETSEPPTTLVDGRWIDARHPERREAVLTENSAEVLGIAIGDEVLATGERTAEPTRLTVVGIVEQPRQLPPPQFIVGLPPSRPGALLGGPAPDALYVATPLAESVCGQPAVVNYAAVALKGSVRPEDFVNRWVERFAATSPPVRPRTAEKVGSEIDGSTTLESARTQALSSMGISLLAALFIIFTTLSMGVDERIRQFAMLRAVSLTRGQIALMILLESLTLGLIGWAGGLLAGWGLLLAAARLKPEVMADGASLGPWSIFLSGLCALGGSLAASVLPAWRATRVAPLEAMVPRTPELRPRRHLILTGLGLLLIAVNPVLTFAVPITDMAQAGRLAAIGCFAMAVGFILVAPAAVWLAEAVFGEATSRLLGLPPGLLANQLSSNLWRTVGTSIALTLGLGLFVAMQTWGYSMLQPYVPGRWAPELIAKVAPVGVAETSLAEVRAIPGLVSNQVVPLAVRHVKFSGDPTGAQVRASSSRQDSCVMVGFDAEVALGGTTPMFGFEFVEGTREEAIRKIRGGRFCLVPDHFTRESGLHVGDRFAVFSPKRPDEAIEYEIAGVVAMPGWQWMTKMGFRRGRAAGLMFSDFATVQRDFETGRPSMFWMNGDGKASEAEIAKAFEAIAKRDFRPELVAEVPLDSPLRIRPDGTVAGPHDALAPSVMVRSAESVRQMIRARADGVIWILSQLPLVTLAVTSLGVVNTVLSSIRARRWELGVLRALGVTRFGLVRLIAAEAILVGLVACVLSLGFGVLAGYCGTGITRYVNTRGGQITPLVIPWGHIAIGFLATLGLCLAAALVPAIRTGRTDTLRLLQSGRAAA